MKTPEEIEELALEYVPPLICWYGDTTRYQDDAHRSCGKNVL